GGPGMAGKAAAAPRTIHRCEACGHAEPKWLGRCPGCGAWNSLVEETSARASRLPPGVAPARPVAAAEVRVDDTAPRRATGIAELDRVLGGGLGAGPRRPPGAGPAGGEPAALLP